MQRMKTPYSLVLTILLSPLVWSQSTNLEVGDKAPDFELQDQDGNAVRLSDFSDLIDKEGIIRHIDSGRDAIDIAGVKAACAQLQ